MPAKLNLQNIAIVLTGTRYPENIGAAARAMLNFGLTELRLVNPRDGWPNEKARAMASVVNPCEAIVPFSRPSSRKWWTRSGMSSRRSRRGGTKTAIGSRMRRRAGISGSSAASSEFASSATITRA